MTFAWRNTDRFSAMSELSATRSGRKLMTILFVLAATLLHGDRPVCCASTGLTAGADRGRAKSAPRIWTFSSVARSLIFTTRGSIHTPWPETCAIVTSCAGSFRLRRQAPLRCR